MAAACAACAARAMSAHTAPARMPAAETLVYTDDFIAQMLKETKVIGLYAFSSGRVPFTLMVLLHAC